MCACLTAILDGYRPFILGGFILGLSVFGFLALGALFSAWQLGLLEVVDQGEAQ